MEKEVWSHQDCFSSKLGDYIRAFIHQEYEIANHSHDFYELNIVLRGRGIHYIEEQAYLLRRGHVFVIPPHVKHSYENIGGLDVFHILIHNRFIAKYSDELEALPSYSQMFNTEPVLRSCNEHDLFLNLDGEQMQELNENLEQLYILSEMDCPEQETMKNSYALYVIAKICGFYRKQYSLCCRTNGNSRQHLLMESIRKIYAEYNQKLTISNLAEAAHVSRSVYIDMFKEFLHCSPGEFILQYRIEKVKQLLEQSALSVTEIAQETGFYDSAHLSRIFFRFTRRKPGEYRRRYGQRRC